MAGKKRKMEDLSMDEFMAGGFESSSSESDRKSLEGKKNAKTKKDKSKKGSKQKKSLKERLKEQDPEFYQFLADEDESLLEMDDDISDNDDLVSDDDDVVERTSDKDDDDIKLPESSDEDNEIPVKKAKPSKPNYTKKSKDKKPAMPRGDEKETLKQKETVKADKKAVTKTHDETSQDIKKSKKKSLKKGSEKNAILEESIKDNKMGNEKSPKKDDKLTKKKKEENDSKKKRKAGAIGDKDSDDDDDDDNVGFDDLEADESDSDEDGGLHKPPDKLEVMTDSEDDEEESVTKSGKTKVSMKMVAEWTKRFKELPSPALLHEAVYAFKAAVQQTASEEVPTKYKVIGSKVFNAVIRMCLVEIPQAVHKILDLPAITDLQKPVLPSSKNQKWKKVRLDMKSYLADVLQLLSNLSQANMIDVLMKHIHRLVAFYACFSSLTKVMLKKVINVWCTGEETSRVLAFLCINRLIRLQQDSMLEPCFKQLYMAYVKNCKFTSPNSLPLINFMQRSLVEVLSLDFALAYQYAFIYIRQLAIHLRNAITTKKKESCQAVYNWQFVHCLGLWVRLLSLTHPNDILEPLIYPLTQTIIGTIKLVPTQRYYPLRFHCASYLTTLSKSTGTFIPVLPFLLEVLEQTDFNKKHKAISFKPLSFTCVLKLSKAQLQERSFKDGVIDQLYELLVEHFNVHAHTIGFPELALPSVLQLKEFLKKCKVGNFTKQIKQIVEKVDENCKFITNRRRTATISLSDTKAIEAWERQCQEAGTPLGKFYTTWRKLRDRELLHQIADKEQIVGDDHLPEIIKPRAPKKATDEEKKEFSALFDTDSEDDVDMTESFQPDKKKSKGKEKPDRNKKKSADSDSEGDYSDFDSDELEQLAGSADESADDEEMEVSDDDDFEADDDDDDDDKDSDHSDDLQGQEDIVKDFTFSSSDED